MFTTAKKDKISTIICRQIREAILQGALKPGEALPPEKELMTQFGVSKHTLREALRALEGMGLIVIKRGAGGGPVVSEITMETARESFATFLHFHDISIHDLSEVRRIIEPYLASQAAKNFKPEEEDAIKAVHDECLKLYAANKCLVGAEAEVMFHVLLAKYTGNPVLWIILDFINNILAETKQKLKPGREFCKKVIDAHQRILDAILAKDPEAAAQYMYDHICEVEENLGGIPEKKHDATYIQQIKKVLR